MWLENVGGVILVFLSVITVVLNCVQTIEKTIKSVVNQEIEGIEYIVIDGGSTDGTLDIIKKYSDRIAYWVSEPDKGIYDAMNKGIMRATGEWVSFINANDWYEQDIFSRLASYMKEGSFDLLYGKVNKFFDNKRDGYIGIYQKTNQEEIHGENLYCHQGLFIKRTMFDLIGLYDCKYKILADYDWILKAHNAGENPQFIDIDVANFTMGGISCSDSSKKECRDIIVKNYANHHMTKDVERKVGKQAFDYFHVYDNSVFEGCAEQNKHFYIWGTGVYGKKCNDVLQTLKYDVRGFIDTNCSRELYLDKKVVKPDGLLKDEEFMKDKNALICVATEKYEDEIISSLNKFGVSKDRYISIGDLFEMARNEYVKVD